MKTLKISLLLVAVLLLTVSVVQTDAAGQEDEKTYKNNSTKIDLLAHKKSKLKIPGHA